MADTTQLDAQLNDMIREGKVLEAFEKFYADDVVMLENDKPTEGKDANRKREQEFFASVEQMHEMKIGRAAVNGDVSFCEQVFDATFKDGNRVKMEQITVRTWKDGQVVRERFYYKGG